MRRAALSLLFALALAGCGGGESSEPGDALAETAANLGEIRSGDLLLEIEIGSGEDTAGFKLEGPFAFAESADELPQAELAYTQLAGSESATVTFISTGENAYVASESGTFELPPEQVSSLLGSGSGSGGGGSGELGELEIGDWFVDPVVTDGGEVGGAETDQISSELDVVAAANGLLQVAGGFGADTQTIDGQGAEQLERAVESATIDVWTGKDDRLLRRLVIEAHFRAAPPEEFQELFRNIPTADIRIELAVGDPNKDVTIEEPADVQTVTTN